MTPIFIIANNTFKEIMRDRILYGLVVFALLFFGVSVALGELTFAERTRISMNFGLAAIQMSAVVLSIFLGSVLVIKEIDKKTVMTLLAHPITRFQFLIGKSLGLVWVTIAILFGLGCVLLISFYFMDFSVSGNLFFAFYGILLESLVLLGFAIFFSSFTTSIGVISFCVGIFLIGHWLDSLDFFIKKSSDIFFVVLGTSVKYLVPDLEVFNWRSLVIYGDDLLLSTVFEATFYALCWFVFLILAASYVLNKKDFT